MRNAKTQKSNPCQVINLFTIRYKYPPPTLFNDSVKVAAYLSPKTSGLVKIQKANKK